MELLVVEVEHNPQGADMPQGGTQQGPGADTQQQGPGADTHQGPVLNMLEGDAARLGT